MTDGPSLNKSPDPDDPPPANDDLTRASNRDRDETHAYLSAAMSAGVLTPDEYSERAALAANARTRADLTKLTADLPIDQLGGASRPGTSPQAARSTFVSANRSQAARKNAIGVFGGSVVGAGNVVGDKLRAIACMGGVDIDLRKVDFASSTVEITCVAIMGGVTVIAPPDVAVRVNGVGVMGGFGHSGAGAGAPGAPEVILRGVAIWGGVDVKRKPYD